MFLLRLIPVVLSISPVVSGVSIISIEKPSKVTRSCSETPLLAGNHIDPLVDDILENGCEHPVRQSDLEAKFKKAVGRNGTAAEQIREMARRELIDWKTFERSHLNIPAKFSDYNSFLLVEDVAPFCKNELIVRICFMNNPTRVFGIPEKFEFPDATSYQIKTSNYYISSYNCTILEDSGRCYREVWPWIWSKSEDVARSSVDPIVAILTMAAIVLGILILIAFNGFIWYWTYRKLAGTEEVVSRKPSIPNLIPNSEALFADDLPFIDSDVFDSCIIEI